MLDVKRQARCWICGVLFEATRGSLPKGARFVCGPCADDGLQNDTGMPLPRKVLAKALYDRHGVPYFDLQHVVIPDEVLQLVPEDFARHHALVPVLLTPLKKKGASGSSGTPGAGNDEPVNEKAPVKNGKPQGTTFMPGSLVVAMTDPANEFALESLRRSSGLPIQPVVSTWAEIVEAIGEQYLRIVLAEESSD